MATKDQVTKVWIEPGCIVCDACETAAPDVFEVLEETCIIRPAALTPDFTKPRTDEIIEAAEECPVDVIKYETVAGEVSDEEAAPAPAESAPASAEAAPAAATAETKKPAEPAAPKEPVPAAAKAAASAPAPAPETSMAGAPDRSIEALLAAATARGGSAAISRQREDLPDSVDNLKRRDPSELPPDGRQARVLEAARKQKGTVDKQRRAVVSGAALTVGWVGFGAGAGIAAGPGFLRFMMPNVLEEPDPTIRVGKLSNYMEMQPKDVNEDFKPQGIWIIREEDRIAALNIICTHLGCIPNWLPNDQKFKCPCHGSGYYYDGINFEGPTPRPLERFRVYVDEGILIVDKSKKYQYELGQWDEPGSYIPA